MHDSCRIHQPSDSGPSKNPHACDRPERTSTVNSPPNIAAIARMAVHRMEQVTPPVPSELALIARRNFMAWIAASNSMTPIGQKDAIREAVRALKDLNDESLCRRLLREQWRDSSPNLQQLYEKMVKKYLSIELTDWQIGIEEPPIESSGTDMRSIRLAVIALAGTLAATIVLSVNSIKKDTNAFFDTKVHGMAATPEVNEEPSPNEPEAPTPQPMPLIKFATQRTQTPSQEMTFRNLAWIRSANLPMPANPEAWRMAEGGIDSHAIDVFSPNFEESMILRNLRWADATFGASSQASIGELETLSAFYMKHCRYSDAEPVLKRLLNLKESGHGATDLGVVNCLEQLGQVYFQQRQYDLARVSFQGVLQIRNAHPEIYHGPATTLLENLGLTELWLGRTGEAKKLLEKVLTIRQQELGSRHPEIASCLDHFGMASLCDTDIDTARINFFRGLEIREKLLGADHPQLIPSLCSVAILNCAEHNHAFAEELLRKAVWISERNFGPDSAFTADCLNNLAKIRLMRAEYADAESLLRRVAKIRLEKLGPDDETTKQSQELIRQVTKRN